MTLQLNWTIDSLERVIKDGFVYRAYYRVRAEKDGAHARITNLVDFPDRPEYLIPYEDLTEDLVLKWVKDELGPQKLSAIEQHLALELEKALHPKVEAGVPWDNNW